MGCACSCRRQETCSAVHIFPGKHDTTSSQHTASIPQSPGLLDMSTGGVFFPEVLGAPADTQHAHGSPHINVANVAIESQGFGSLRQTGEAGLTGSEQFKEHDGQKCKESYPALKAKSRRFGSIESILILPEDEDSCPICLEEYDKQNPRINTFCEHHYHLSCILEWMERSDNCPMCDEELLFTESL